MVHFGALMDPSMWVTEALFMFLMMFFRFPMEFLRWQMSKRVRAALRDLERAAAGDRELLDYAHELITNYHEAPRILRAFYAFSIIQQARSAQAAAERRARATAYEQRNASDEPAPDESRHTVAANSQESTVPPPATTSDVDGATASEVSAFPSSPTPSASDAPSAGHPEAGVVEPEADKPVLPSSGRPKLGSILVNAFCRAMCYVVMLILLGGETGHDYQDQTWGDLEAIGSPFIRFFSAISNVFGAFPLLVTERIAPFFRTVVAILANREPRWLLIVDRLMSSDALSGVSTGLFDGSVVLGVWSLFGRVPAEIAALPITALSYFILMKARKYWHDIRTEEGERRT